VRAVGSKERSIMIGTASNDRGRLDPAPATIPRASGRPGLSRDEEIELAERIARGDHQARNRMIQAHLALVGTIARGFRHRGLSLEDLIGEGNLGLIRAAEEFDPRFGTRFSTYAAYWIKEAIRHALINTTATIRVPARMAGVLARWRRAERTLGRQLGRTPSFDEIASSLGLSAIQKGLVARALDAGRLRLEGSSVDRVGAPFFADVADRHGRADDLVEAEDERAVARRLIDRLDARERTIVALRYGLEGEILKRVEIGRRLGVTREWVRQLEARALRKLGEWLHEGGDHPAPRPSR
jgi:RNA polymerase primary sigma factor